MCLIKIQQKSSKIEKNQYLSIEGIGKKKHITRREPLHNIVEFSDFTKVPKTFFTELEKTILQVTGKHETAQTTKATLRRKTVLEASRYRTSHGITQPQKQHGTGTQKRHTGQQSAERNLRGDSHVI